MGSTVMLFGLGELGSWVLYHLSRREGVTTIIACDKRAEYGQLLTDFVAAGAGTEGHCKNIKFDKCDVFNVEATAELINKYDPDVIYTSMVLLSWKLPTLLPPGDAKKAGRMLGTLLPGHFTLPYKLMQAVKQCGTKAVVVQNSQPDTVNSILWKCGLGVLTGAGNLDNLCTELRRSISIKENVPIKEVIIYLIAEHAIGWMGTREDSPFYIKVMIGDRNITNKYDIHSYISNRLLSRMRSEWSSKMIFPEAAYSATRIIGALVNDTNELLHAPGPNGLMGGYPVRISANGVKVELPEGVTMEEAIKLNTKGAKLEGIEEIKDDGTVVVTEEAHELTKQIMGIDCKTIRPEEMEDRAKELIAAFRRLGHKYKFEVPVY